MLGRFAQTLRMQWEAGAGTFMMRWILHAADQVRSVPACRLHQANSVCERKGPVRLFIGRERIAQKNSDVRKRKLSMMI